MPNRPELNRQIFIWMPVYIWAFIIFVFAVLPSKTISLSGASHIDWAAHFLEYAVFSGLLMRSFLCTGRLFSKKIFVFTLILGSGYGILMELVQHFIPTREVSLFDVIFNFAGVLAGIITGKLILCRK